MPEPELVLQRWLLPLPEVLPLPDGWTLTEKVADRPDQTGQADDIAVTVIVHRVQVPAARTASAALAVDEVVRRTPGLTPRAPQSDAGLCK